MEVNKRKLLEFDREFIAYIWPDFFFLLNDTYGAQEIIFFCFLLAQFTWNLVMDLDTFVQNPLRNKAGGSAMHNPYNVLQDNTQSREHL